MKRPDLPVLTSLRFPAAFAIVLYHFLSSTGAPRWSWAGLNSGVSFFYVLSGFILYYNYSDLRAADRGYFWIARIARIWPLHVATCLLVFCLLPFGALLGHASWPITFPANLFLVQAWFPFKGSVNSYNGVAWSLSVEAFFYLTFPWFLRLLNKRGASIALGLSFCIGLILVLAATVIFPAHASYVGQFNPLCRLFEFVLGMCTCRLWINQARPIHETVWSGYEALALITSFILMMTLPLFIEKFIVANALTHWLGTTLCAMGFAALIWVFAHQAGIASRILFARFFTWLGEISFAVYMCHQIILRWLGIGENPGDLRGPQIFAVYLFLTLALAALLFYLVETPARHAIVAAYKRRRIRNRDD